MGDSRRTFLQGAAAVGGSALLPTLAGAATADVETDKDVSLVLSDGTRLMADVYWPSGEGPWPVLLQRTPYDKRLFAGLGAAFAGRGFIFVVQDVRGQFASGGIFEPWVNEGRDGYESIEWAATLRGATGKVGTLGGSYSGICQWQAALRRPPHLAAMAVHVAPVDYFDQWVYPGGAFALAFNQTWMLRSVANSAAAGLPDGAAIQARMRAAHDSLLSGGYRHLPLNDLAPLEPRRPEVAGYYFDWINRHAVYDDYWRRLSLRGRYGEITTPVLNLGGWYDVFVPGTVEAFNGLRSAGGSVAARASSELVIGPWGHLDWGPKLGEVNFGPAAQSPYFERAVAWFERWLKGVAPVSEAPTVRYFMMGENAWRTAPDWPPPGVNEVRYYLDSEGAANSLTGVGHLSLRAGRGRPDRFVYDPENPVPSIGGHSCCYAPESPIGPYDQRAVEARPDVLVYSTPPLAEAVEIAGPVTVELYAASSAVDTDFTAKLVDVDETGLAINLCEGVIRARFRDSWETPEPIRPGAVYKYRITLNPTANRFKRSHRIRLEISSSNFPVYDRNANTGQAIGQSAETIVAEQTIFHDRGRPSALVLPVLFP